jgi:hypothetical protein
MALHLANREAVEDSSPLAMGQAALRSMVGVIYFILGTRQSIIFA